MSVEFADSFDHLSAAQLIQKWNAASSIVGATKGTGVYGIGEGQQYSSAGRVIITPTFAGAATRIACFHVYLPTLPGSDQLLCAFFETTTQHADIRVTSTGAIRGTRNGTSLGISAGTPLVAGNWYWICVRATIDNSAGAIRVTVNGTEELNLTSVDTQNGGTAVCDHVRLNTPVANTIWDNFILMNTSGSVLNDIPTVEYRASVATADGAGNQADWTPSASTNQSNVDDGLSHDTDSTYNSSSTPTDVDTFAIGAIDSAPVAFVQACIVARKDDGGTREIREVCRSNGTDYNGSTQAVTSAYLCYRQIREVDPDTSAAWDSADLNAAEFGYGLVT
jgi:hypothetical protein